LLTGAGLKGLLMRLFIALDIDDCVRERIARFEEGVRNLAPDARWMKPESLHVTLKFIGEQPEDSIEKIKQTLSVVGASTSEIHFRNYGFFPTPKSARVFWVGMEAGPQLAALAGAIDGTLSGLEIPRETRAFSPHLTLARGVGGSGAPHRNRSDRPNRVFQRLQEKLGGLPPPEFGSMLPGEFYLYQSHLSPKGSTYTKLAGFALK
jgi:RNA 2',3'-cyclic 3'-phosphodiesterase